MFGRRKQQENVEVEVDPLNFVDDLDPEDRALEDAELLRELELREVEERRASLERTEGPYDLAVAPAHENGRLALGALHVVVLPDIEVRVEVSPDGEVVAVTMVHGDSTMQLNAFAAPRSEGIWDEVRSEIAEALSTGGGQAQEVDGPFGRELRAGVPTEVPGQGVVLTAARFLGVDGPRWFLRALLTGPAAVEDGAAAPLLGALRLVAVDRGSEAMAVRDPLPLVLPTDAMPEAPADDEGSPLAMPERGPEITEIR